MPDAARLLTHLVEICAEAGQRVVEIRARPSVMATKGDGSPLSEADLASDAIIAEGLARHAPGIPVV
jgi:3'(2'), 5'-bisphosphate nucleotidase